MDLWYQIAFYGGIAVFFGTHLFTAYRKRDGAGIADRMHRGAYMGLYSLVTVVGFVAMVWGYAMLRDSQVQVWAPPPWTHHVTVTLMLPAIILLVATYMPPPGFIKKAVRHPMLTAVILWSIGHLTANGDLHSIVLFGSFFLFSVLDRIRVSQRGDVGAANVTPNILGDLLSIAVGAAIYGLLVYQLHQILFGLAPLG